MYDLQGQKNFIQAWFDDLPGVWRFEVSPNGWTTDEIGLRWLQKLFIPATTSRTKGKFRLLILDGHGSRLTPQFDEICAQNNVIPICMTSTLVASFTASRYRVFCDLRAFVRSASRESNAARNQSY